MKPRATRLTVLLPQELVAEVRRRVGAGGVSAFVAGAIAHELERERVGALLDHLDREIGPVSRSALEGARRAWRTR